MNKLMRNHPRLWISLAVGCMIFFLLPERWSSVSRVLVCWNCGVSLFLALVFFWMVRLTAEQICMRYSEEDDSAPVILIVVTIAALLSLVAIVEPLATVKQATGTERIAHFALAALTLVNSWILVPTMFATHYADMFYSAQTRQSAGAFSGNARAGLLGLRLFLLHHRRRLSDGGCRDFERRRAQGGPCAYVDLVSIQSVHPGFRDQRHRGPHRRKLSTLARRLIGSLASDPVAPQPLQAPPVRPAATVRRAAGVVRR